MKLEKLSEDIDDFGGENNDIVGGIRMENLPLFMDFLSNQVYSDPPGSIVRELTSNCYDAHASLQKITGVEVEDAVIVKYEEVEGVGTLSFRDFGTGMSPEIITSTYVNLLDSTKRDNNDEHGGYGIGSKSFLSYTDSVDVITIVDGMKYHYIVGKNVDGLIAATPLFKKETLERNGTEVRLILKDVDYRNSRYDSEDYELFKKAVEKQLYYFDNVYTEGFEIENNYSIFETNTFKYRESYNHPFEELHVILGRAVYPIDWKQVEMEPIKLPVGIKFNIGELPVTLSRENLRYANKNLVNILKAKIEETLKEVVNLYNKNSAIIAELGNYISKIKYNNKYLTINACSIPFPNKMISNNKGEYVYIDAIDGLLPIKYEPLKHVPLLKIPKDPYFIFKFLGKINKIDGRGTAKLEEVSTSKDDVFSITKSQVSMRLYRIRGEASREKVKDRFINSSKQGLYWYLITKKKCTFQTFNNELELGEVVKRNVPTKISKWNDETQSELLVDSTKKISVRTPFILEGHDKDGNPYVWNKTRIIKEFKKAITADLVSRSQSYENTEITAHFLAQEKLNRVTKKKVKLEGHVTIYDIINDNGNVSSELDLSTLQKFSGFIIYAEKDRAKELKLVRDMLSNQAPYRKTKFVKCHSRTIKRNSYGEPVLWNAACKIFITAKGNHKHFKDNRYYMHLEDFLSNNNRLFRNCVTAWYVKRELYKIEKEHTRLYDNLGLFNSQLDNIDRELSKWAKKHWNSYYSMDEFMQSCYEIALEKNMLVIDKIQELDIIKEWFTPDLGIIGLLEEKAFINQVYIKDIVFLLKSKKKRLSAEHYFIPTKEEEKVLEEAKELVVYQLSLEPMKNQLIVYNNKLKQIA